VISAPPLGALVKNRADEIEAGANWHLDSVVRVLRSFVGLRVTIMTEAAEDYAGFDNTHTVRIAWINAGSVADDTIDVLDAPALNALDVVVIIIDARFVPCAGGIRQAATPDQAHSRKVVYDQMDGLKGDCRQQRTNGLKDGLGIGMRMMMQKIQDRRALCSRAQPFGSQGLNPVVGV
jgi:hypothetical protein